MKRTLSSSAYSGPRFRVLAGRPNAYALIRSHWAALFVALASLGVLSSMGCSQTSSEPTAFEADDAWSSDSGLADTVWSCSEGSQRLAEDGCNLCTCVSQQWSCTQTRCAVGCIGREPQALEACPIQTVFARGPSLECCRYASPCLVPEGEQQFFGENACSRGCELGTSWDSEDGCERCVCEASGWVCEALCQLSPAGCTTDADCMVGGCFAELCGVAPQPDLCEWRTEYACFREPLTHCMCQAGVCDWAPTVELDACLSLQCVSGEHRAAGDGCNQCWCDERGTWICTQRDCATCPPAIEDPSCEPEPIWARDPQSSTCCAYPSACAAPQTWEQFDDAPSCGDCRAGDVEVLSDGCTSCFCLRDGQWVCLDTACQRPCQQDSDCLVTGCNGEFCAPAPLYSSCEWQDKYACLAASVTSCSCQEGLCAWADSPALEFCMSSP